MKNEFRQASKVPYSNRIKGQTNLANSPHFDQAYGPYGKSGNPTGYFTYAYLGHEIRLRWSQATHRWTATCPTLDNVQTNFLNQSPQEIRDILDNWIMDHVGMPISCDAHLRQTAPSIRQLADIHGVPLGIVLEIYEERAI